MPRRSVSNATPGVSAAKSGPGVIGESAVPVGFRHQGMDLLSALVAPDAESLLDGRYTVVGHPDQMATAASKAAMLQEEARPLPGIVSQKAQACQSMTLLSCSLGQLALDLGLTLPEPDHDDPCCLPLDGTERVRLEVREVSKSYHSRPRSVLRHFWPSDTTLNSHSQRGFLGMTSAKVKLYVVTSLWCAANVALHIDTTPRAERLPPPPPAVPAARARRASAPAVMQGGGRDCSGPASCIPPALCATLQTLLDELAANGGGKEGNHVLYVPLDSPMPVAAEVMKMTWSAKAAGARVEPLAVPQAPPRRRQWDAMSEEELWDCSDVGTG